MELARQYIENEKQIRAIRDERDKIWKETHEEVQRLDYVVYARKIRALQDERDEKIQKLNKKKDEQIAEKDKQIDALHIVIANVDQILNFLRIKKKDLTIVDTDVHVYNDKHCESLGYIFDDDLLKVKLFIMENRKPKNKYSLVAIGRCLFDRELVGLPYSYGTPCHVTSWHNVEVVIKDLPTTEELYQYLRKRKHFILTCLLGKYEDVKKEYLEVLQTYKPEDFEALMKYRCTCGFFYTANEISRRSVRDGVTCPRCGSVMTKSP